MSYFFSCSEIYTQPVQESFAVHDIVFTFSHEKFLITLPNLILRTPVSSNSITLLIVHMHQNNKILGINSRHIIIALVNQFQYCQSPPSIAHANNELPANHITKHAMTTWRKTRILTQFKFSSFFFMILPPSILSALLPNRKRRRPSSPCAELRYRTQAIYIESDRTFPRQ